MVILLILLVIAAIIYGYTRSTPYGPKKFLGGYSETQLGPDMYAVKFEGNGNVNSDKSVDFCLIRSAELTQEKGYKYFYIIDNRTANQHYSRNGSSHPSSNNTIKMVNEKPGNDIALYDAAFIVQSYKKKYNINR